MWVFILIFGLPLLAWGLITISHRQQSEAEWAAEAQRDAERQADIQDKQSRGIACCPYCGSTALSANKRGYKLGRGLFWALLLGGIGYLYGSRVAMSFYIAFESAGDPAKAIQMGKVVCTAVGAALGLSLGSIGAAQVNVTCLSCGKTHRAGARK